MINLYSQETRAWQQWTCEGRPGSIKDGIDLSVLPLVHKEMKLLSCIHCRDSLFFRFTKPAFGLFKLWCHKTW